MVGRSPGIAAIDDQADEWAGEAALDFVGPVTASVFCGYDDSQASSSSTHNPTDFIVIALTSDSTDMETFESWIEPQGILLLVS